MSYLLHINTALDRAYVAVSRENQLLASRRNDIQKEHGSFLQPAIKTILQEAGLGITNVSAISVVNGPGSYTGLRVALSAAKGICFALNKPLICLSTLEWLAHPFFGNMTDIICPMIDARRMEVFTAMYLSNLDLLIPPQAMIIDENSFPELEDKKIIFTGDGRNKLPERVSAHPNCIFPTSSADISDQIDMANMAYREEKFSDLAYTEPFYIKSFYTTLKK